MNKKVHTIGVVIIVILISVTVVGCSGENNIQIVPRILTLYNPGASPGERELWDQAKKEFEGSHPGVTVNYVTYTGKVFSTSDYLRQLDDLMQSETPADLILGNTTMFPILEKRG